MSDNPTYPKRVRLGPVRFEPNLNGLSRAVQKLHDLGVPTSAKVEIAGINQWQWIDLVAEWDEEVSTRE